MKLAVFGATGRTGQHIVEQALDAGHEVVALARTPSKLTIQNPRLKVIQGDVQDAGCVDQVIASVDAVVSALGPTQNTPDYKVSRGTANILTAMKKYGVRRLVISAGAGVGDPNDSPKLINHFISFLLRLVSKHVVEDMTRTVSAVRNSDRDWTIVRVPMLTDSPKTGNVRIGWVGNGTGTRISRADMAEFMLKQVSSTTYSRQAPMISN